MVSMNKLQYLSENLGNLKQLKKLWIQRNRFTDFPSSLNQLKLLEGL